MSLNSNTDDFINNLLGNGLYTDNSQSLDMTATKAIQIEDSNRHITIPLFMDNDVFKHNGKRIRSERFIKKVLRKYKSLIDSQVFWHTSGASPVLLCESRFSIIPYVLDIESAVKAQTLRLIVLNQIDCGIAYYFTDYLTVNEEERSLEFSKEKTLQEYEKFYECLRNFQNTSLKAAEEFFVDILCRHEDDLHRTNLLNFTEEGLEQYKRSLVPSKPEPKVIQQERHYPERFYRETLRELFDHFKQFQIGEISAQQYKYDAQNVFKFLTETKGISLN